MTDEWSGFCVACPQVNRYNGGQTWAWKYIFKNINKRFVSWCTRLVTKCLAWLTAPFRARDLRTRLVAENQCLWWVLLRVNTVRSPGWSWRRLCRILRVILKFRDCLFPQSAPWLGCWFPSNSWSAAAWSSSCLSVDTMSFLLVTGDCGIVLDRVRSC